VNLGEYVAERINEEGPSALQDIFNHETLDRIGAQAYEFDELKTERYRSEPLDRMRTMYIHRQNDYRPTFVDPSYREFETDIENGLFLDHCAIMGTAQQMVWMMETGKEENMEQLLSGLKEFTDDNEFYLDGSDIKPDNENFEIFAPTVVWDIVDKALGSGKAIRYPSNLRDTMLRNDVPNYVVNEVQETMNKIGEPLDVRKYWKNDEDGAIARTADDYGLTIVSVDKDFPLGIQGQRTESNQSRKEIHRIQPNIANPLSLGTIDIPDDRPETGEALLEIDPQGFQEVLRLLDSGFHIK